MEIRPGKCGGVGQLLFGLTEQELVRALGPPDKRYHTDSEVLLIAVFCPRGLSSRSSPSMGTASAGWKSTARMPLSQGVG